MVDHLRLAINIGISDRRITRNKLTAPVDRSRLVYGRKSVQRDGLSGFILGRVGKCNLFCAVKKAKAKIGVGSK